VIVATSVAEEGVDMPECERVISLYPPSTVTALVQMRGRARRKNSKFIVLCSNQEEEGKLYDIMQKEKNMIEATQLLMQENGDTEPC
jgi:ERCC4-related helicase